MIARDTEQRRNQGWGLMGEAIVILAPTGTGREEICSGIIWAPFHAGRLVEELQVLENLRSDDCKKSFVTRHDGRFASDEVTDHASKQGIFGKHLDDSTIRGFG